MSIGGLCLVTGGTTHILLWLSNLALLPNNVHAENDDDSALRFISYTWQGCVMAWHRIAIYFPLLDKYAQASFTQQVYS